MTSLFEVLSQYLWLRDNLDYYRKNNICNMQSEYTWQTLLSWEKPLSDCIHKVADDAPEEEQIPGVYLNNPHTQAS